MVASYRQDNEDRLSHHDQVDEDAENKVGFEFRKNLIQIMQYRNPPSTANHPFLKICCAIKTRNITQNPPRYVNQITNLSKKTNQEAPSKGINQSIIMPIITPQ